MAGILHFKKNSIMQDTLCTKMPGGETSTHKYLKFLKTDYYMINQKSEKNKTKQKKKI